MKATILSYNFPVKTFLKILLLKVQDLLYAFSSNIAVEQGVIVTGIAIALFVFRPARFGTPTHVQSKPSRQGRS